ncbi:hypothetical protein [Sphingomonas sp. UV9]|uniref:hypothetical protein n=1 Tax=Sphingomonas sp. UV9 TaxID=1851410 RepID=UPI0013E89A3C|nr:hypothetical protein [Sphingomonas sp. UV9]
MFLDETHNWPRREDLPPRKPVFKHEKALSRILLFYAIVLLLLPVSLGGFVDLFRYVFD